MMSKYAVIKLSQLLFFLGVCFQTFTVSAKTSVWEISNDNHKLFLGGTVHVLSADDYPLPCEFDRAFNQADKLYFETDIKQLETPQFAAKLMLEGTYPSGVSLLDKLSPATKNKLTLFFAESGLPGMAFVKFKPGLLLSTIAVIELQRLGVTLAGVDKHYENLAKESGKEIAYLETTDEQIAFILQLGEGNEDKFVEYLIESMGMFSKQFNQLLLSWRTGDIEQMAAVSDFAMLKKEFPSIYEVLIAKRNKNWLIQINTMLEDADTEYVLVGGLHMVGDIGLLAMLEKQGYQVKQLDSPCES